jgi:hypothetical protein
VEIGVGLVDGSGLVAQASFELLFPEAVFDASTLPALCVLDPRLQRQVLSAALPPHPPAPEGFRRARFVVFDLATPAALLGSGPLLNCPLTIRADAAPGTWPINFDQVFTADSNARPVGPVGGVGGEVVVDPEAPLPSATPTSTGTPTATMSHTQSATASATASSEPAATATTTPTPTETQIPVAPTATATPRPCAGDCNGNGTVDVSELIRGVNIALGTSATADCPAMDDDNDGAVLVNELVIAVNAALVGCPVQARNE